jgi:hypothetical protein
VTTSITIAQRRSDPVDRGKLRVDEHVSRLLRMQPVVTHALYMTAGNPC